MLTATIKQLPWILALLVLGPIAGFLTGSLHAGDGSGNATLLFSTTPLWGVMVGLIVLVLAGAAGLFGSLVNGSRSGLNTMGIVLAWAAWQIATIEGVLRQAQSVAPLKTLAIEGLVFGLMLVPVGMTVWQAGLGRGLHGQIHRLADGAPGLMGWLRAGLKRNGELAEESHSLFAGVLGAIVRPAGLAAVGITVVVGAAVCWLIAQETLKGQALFAAVLTFLVAVPIARLAGESLKQSVPTASFFIGAALLAAIGPFAAQIMHSDHIIADLYSGNLIGVAVPVTLDWFAGACLGIPLGEAWFYSMFAQQQAAAQAIASR